MARSIKQIAHDLAPSIKMISEISETLSECLLEMADDIEFKNKDLKKCYNDSIQGIQSLDSFAKLMLAYINEVNTEADLEHIPKTYDFKPVK